MFNYYYFKLILCNIVFTIKVHKIIKFLTNYKMYITLLIKIFFYTNIAIILYQTFLKCNILFTANPLETGAWNLSKYNAENTHFILTYPVVLNLFVFSVITTIISVVEGRLAISPFMILKYYYLGARVAFKFASIILKELSSKSISKIKLFFNFLILFFKKVLNAFSSLMLLWRPLFKRISYFGRFIRNRNFWKKK